MSTGTDHYRAAERLLAGATSHQPPTGHLDRRELFAAAEVHALLAAAAATAHGSLRGADADDARAAVEADAWLETLNEVRVETPLDTLVWAVLCTPAAEVAHTPLAWGYWSTRDEAERWIAEVALPETPHWTRDEGCTWSSVAVIPEVDSLSGARPTP